VRGRIWIRGPGRVRIGSLVVLDASNAPIELHTLEPDAEIVIGDGVRIDGGTSIEAVRSVTLGDGVSVGAFAKIMDCNFHPLAGDRHERPVPHAVAVEAGAQLGARSVLLAGARVGRNAVVCSGAVVSRRSPVPEGATARGNPAVIG
jgi:UDP-2-acetamido-3-amino-2,3-dideoxy-glucuronate N-acetyltransferase